MVRIHTIIVLKHPQALSLQSICLSKCVCKLVFTPPHLHAPTCAVQRGREPCRGLGNRYSQISDAGFLRHATQQAARASWWAALGNPGTILVKAMPEGGKWLLERSFSDPHPKKIASKHPFAVRKKKGKEKRKKMGRLGVYKGFHFRNSRAARCHVDLTSMPTHAENHPSAHKGEYTCTCMYIYLYLCIHSSTEKHATTIPVIASKKNNLFLLFLSLSFPFPPPTYFLMFLPLYFLCPPDWKWSQREAGVRGVMGRVDVPRRLMLLQ